MTPRQLTGWFVVASFVVIVAFDGFMWWRYGARATISCVVRDWSRTCPAVPGLVAAAMVYLWWHWFGR